MAPTRLCRFQKGGNVSYGLVEVDTVRPIEGDPFHGWKPGSERFALITSTASVRRRWSTQLAFRKRRVRDRGGDPERDRLVAAWRADIAALRTRRG
jgi:hypothetical protein